MNTQQALEQVYSYFADVRHKAGYRDNMCVYYANGSDAVRCAIGCLIPEEFQERAGRIFAGIDTLCAQIPELDVLFRDVDRDVLESLQTRHDAWAIPALASDREDFLMHVQMLMRYEEDA